MKDQRAQRIASATANVASTGFTTTAFDVAFADLVSVYVTLSRSASTATFFTIQYSLDGTVWHTQQSESIAAGTSTLSNYTVSKTVSANANWLVHLTPNAIGLDGTSGMCRFVFDSTAGDASDLVTVDVVVKRS